MNRGDPDSDGFEDAEQRTAAGLPRPDDAPGTTVGTGSALGVGCVIVIVVLVLIALAVRWLTGSW
jgi:hypothetical protein